MRNGENNRNLEEEAHLLGLSSWDRVDKWLKRKKKIITVGNPVPKYRRYGFNDNPERGKNER